MQKQALLKTIFYLALAFFIFSPAINAQSAQAKSPNDTLRVALAGSEPFIIHSETGEGPSGIAVEIWENIAEDRNLNYRYESFGSVGEAISALGNGSVDLIVGPVSITSERVLEMGFSQPYYQSSLAIVSRATNPNLWENKTPFQP